MVREGVATLAELAASVLRANLVLLIASPDVTLMELNTPPMSEAKLKLALSNLVEDHLMSDVKECVLVPGAKSVSGARSVAVVQREWLQKLATHFFAQGASQVRAVPAQLCLPLQAGQCSVALDDQAAEASLTLRSGAESGMGILQEPGQSVTAWLNAVNMLASPGPVHLWLAPGSLQEFQTALESNPAWAERMTIGQSTWSATVLAAKSVAINLMTGLQGSKSNQIQWQAWRWPVVLTTLVLLVNIAALNYDYWSQKREAQALNQNMLQTYRTSFPKETVVVYPLEQMRKNLDLAERNSGQPALDDFTLLLSQFGAAWNGLNPAALPKLVSIEYKERALLLQVNGELAPNELKSALDGRGLVLKKMNAEVWQVRVAR